MQTLKVGLTGPHSSGKTTLLDALHDVPEFEGVTFLPEITRQIKERGFNINEAGTLDTQVLVMAAHMNNLLLNGHFVVDRSLLDGVVYTEFLYEDGKIPQWFMDYCYNLLDEYIDAYDIIFYLPPEFAVAEDGVRSTGKKFHEQVSAIFDRLVNKYSAEKPNLIVPITGTVEERVSTVVKTVRAYKGDVVYV